MKRRLHLILATLSALSGGCGEDDTSVPQPQPVPGVLKQFIRQSTPRPDQPQPRVLIVGLPGAAAGAGTIRALQQETRATATVPASASGSFSLSLPQGTIELRYENTDGLSEPLILASTLTWGGLQLDPGRNNTDRVVSPPAYGTGLVTVSNRGSGGPLLLATANVQVIVSNSNSGAVVTSTTDAEGYFTVEIPAASGDLIQIMLVDPQSTDNTSDFFAESVP